jgi:hypothetical protein
MILPLSPDERTRVGLHRSSECRRCEEGVFNPCLDREELGLARQLTGAKEFEAGGHSVKDSNNCLSRDDRLRFGIRFAAAPLNLQSEGVETVTD